LGHATRSIRGTSDGLTRSIDRCQRGQRRLNTVVVGDGGGRRQRSAAREGGQGWRQTVMNGHRSTGGDDGGQQRATWRRRRWRTEGGLETAVAANKGWPGGIGQGWRPTRKATRMAGIAPTRPTLKEDGGGILGKPAAGDWTKENDGQG
jgi:hypothetical protein